MAVHIKCPNGHRIRTKTKCAGTTVRCPACHAITNVPTDKGTDFRGSSDSENHTTEPPSADDGGVTRRWQRRRERLTDPVHGQHRPWWMPVVRRPFIARWKSTAVWKSVARRNPVDLMGSKCVLVACAGLSGFLIGRLVETEERYSAVSWSDTRHKPAATSTEPDQPQSVESSGQRPGIQSREDAFGSFRKVHFTNELEKTVQSPAGRTESGTSAGGSLFRGSLVGSHSLVPLEAVTLAEHDAAWQVTRNCHGHRAVTVFTRLANELGLTFTPDPDVRTNLQNIVSFKAADRSRFEIIEELGRQLGMTPRYSSRTLGMQSGHRRNPVVFAGPFVISVLNVRTATETATGDLTLQCFTGGLRPVVMQQLKSRFGVPIDVTKVVDRAGNDLLRLSRSAGALPEHCISSFDCQMSLGLQHLLRRVDVIHSLDGVVRFSLPTAVEVFHFNNFSSGTKQKQGPVTFTFTESRLGSCSLECEGVDIDQVQLLGFDARGRQVRSFSSNNFFGERRGTISKSFTKPLPVRFEVRVATKIQPVEYRLALTGIPVPDHCELPEKVSGSDLTMSRR